MYQLALLLFSVLLWHESGNFIIGNYKVNSFNELTSNCIFLEIYENGNPLKKFTNLIKCLIQNCNFLKLDSSDLTASEDRLQLISYDSYRILQKQLKSIKGTSQKKSSVFAYNISFTFP